MLSVQKKVWDGSLLYIIGSGGEGLCHSYFRGLEARAPHTLALAGFQGVLFKVCDKYVMTFTSS
jgi:hypothetical protein